MEKKNGKITLLSPVGEPEILDFPLAPRLNSIEGKTIGLLDNLKSNASVVLDWTTKRLADRYSSLEFISRRKPVQAAPVPEAIVKEFREKCDFVIVALAY